MSAKCKHMKIPDMRINCIRRVTRGWEERGCIWRSCWGRVTRNCVDIEIASRWGGLRFSGLAVTLRCIALHICPGGRYRAGVEHHGGYWKYRYSKSAKKINEQGWKFLHIPPPPWGGGELIKRFGDGEGKGKGKKVKKKRKIEENIDFWQYQMIKPN